MTIANSGARDFEAEVALFRDLTHGNHTASKSVNFEAKRANGTLLAKVNYSPILFVYFQHAQFPTGIVQIMRHEISPVSCRLLALLICEEANADHCNDPKKLPASEPEAIVKCETVVRKRAAKAASAPGYSLPPAAQNTPQAPPQLPSSLKPDWVYVGTGIVDSHIGEKRIFVDGRPTDRYSGVTLITPFEQSQYNPYPVGPEIGVGWKTPALAAYGITDIGAGFTVFRNSLYRTATILGFRVGHDLAAGINAGLIVGPIFSGYSQPVAVAAELELDLKEIAVSQRWDIADVIPNGLVIKNRVMPCKAEFWAPGEGVNAAFELWAGFKFRLQ